MINKIGNKNFALLAKMLDLNSAALRVHAQNVANVNTPNYRRRTFEFQDALRQAMREGTESAYSSVRGWVDRPNNTAVRNNGNNVDIDLETMGASGASRSYQIYTALYNKKSGMLKSAIRGSR